MNAFDKAILYLEAARSCQATGGKTPHRWTTRNGRNVCAWCGFKAGDR